MNKIEKMVKELCPDGIEWKKLGEVTYWDKKFKDVDNILQDKVVKFKHVEAQFLKSIAVSQGDIKLLSTGNFDGYTIREAAGNNINQGEVITIPSGGSANIKYYSGYFIDSGNLLGISKDVKRYSLKYVYYFLQSKNSLISSYFRGPNIKHPVMSAILSILIPVPPLEVQAEIVKILDNFTELQAELQARKKQYEYYRDKLLSFDNILKRGG